jgi:CelD/BcsL family acetyltransferase involved in cellulose biosynthesis
MRIACQPAAALGRDDWARWQAIVDQTPALASPYFTAEFCRAVARWSPDLEVATLREGAAVVGYFPFHRGRFGGGRPLAKWLSDCQGVVCGAGVRVDPRALMRACGLAAFEFDHLLAAQSAFAPFAHRADESPILDLAAGFDAYAAAVAPASAVLGRLTGTRRRLERDLGPVTFELQSTDEAALDALFRLKSEQYRRTGRRDVVGDPWARAVLTEIFRARGPSFAGVLSVLRAGTRAIALHLGMRSAKVLHYWFPAYDREYAQYSPGLMLLGELSRAAAAQGITSIDLGKGDAAYKRRFATGSVRLLEGRIERLSPLALWRAGRRFWWSLRRGR